MRKLEDVRVLSTRCAAVRSGPKPRVKCSNLLYAARHTAHALGPLFALVCFVGVSTTLAPLSARADIDPVEERLRKLEARQAELEKQIAIRDERIRQIVSQGNATPGVAGAPSRISSEQKPAAVASAPSAVPRWGAYEPGKGFVLARTGLGELDFGVFTYARYLNTTHLNDTFTDAFGRVKPVATRNDVQFQKVLLSFKGWLLDPKLRYLLYTWTSNTSQGQGAQVIIAGNITYAWNDYFQPAVGIASLPGVRTTNWTFPIFLRNDNRTIADEFFRPSYTSGIWSTGKIVDKVHYRVMIGDNLSQLGVSAGQLSNQFGTVAAAVWWMPTTGEYGPLEGFGDLEQHAHVATLFGVHYTRSRETRQSQPNTDSFENTQTRLSDGTLLFSKDPFGTGTTVSRLSYQMWDVNGGLKFAGLSLDIELYHRLLDNILASGPLPRDRFTDDGWQAQASAMLMPRTLQGYVSGSKIYGQYGNPYDVGFGLNWFPYHRRELRVNEQILYTNRSPIGGASLPYTVGGNGWGFSTELIFNF